MKRKKIIAIVLSVVGVLSVGAAEARADSFVVKQGFYETSNFHQNATFSGDNFAVDYFLGGGIGVEGPGLFEEGLLLAAFGNWTPPPSVPPGTFFGSGSGTIQVGDVSCEIADFPDQPDCGGFLTFTSPPLGTPPPGFFMTEAPFTMTGKLVFPNMVVDLEGSGILHVTIDPFTQGGSLARYEFAAVPEPSTVVLVMSGLAAAGWSRRRRGKRSVCRG